MRIEPCFRRAPAAWTVVALAGAAAWTAWDAMVRAEATRDVALVGPVSMNRASAAEFELLPGVGPVLAERLVEDRARNGPYRSAADLARVRGVGPAMVARMTPHVAP